MMSAASESMIGKILNHYRILGELGRGAMGQVYLAQDCRLDRKVALKMLPPDLVADPMRRRRFDRESRALAALNHPNVVTIHSVEEADGLPFLVMEWIQGVPLSELIPQDGLPLERLLGFAVPMVDAVAKAHAAGIVHRDLKPANVMVRDDGVVKVVDFGISKMEHETVADGRLDGTVELRTAEGHTLGTLPYMSPQQLEGRPLDARSDIFSLGVILYEMATGHLPFRGMSSASVVSAILRDPPPPFGDVPAPRTGRLEAIVRRCLAKDPAQRYQTAGELRDALMELRQASTQGITLVAPPTLPELPAVPAAGSAPRKRWLLPAVAAGLLLLVLAVGAGLWLRTGRTAAEPAPLQAPSADASASVAVLPLRNLSGDPEQEYFSEGTTEAIIASLAKIGGVRVSSRTSVMRFKEARAGLPEIARELGVSHVLEGSVSRQESRVRITVQLVDAATDDILWTETYQRDFQDIFDVQQEVAREVARAARVELTSSDLSRLAQVQEVEPEVYELYLKARFLFNKRRPDTIRQALDLLDEALARNPEYALAWTAKAECYTSLVSFGLAAMPTREGVPKARAAAQRALEIDDSLSEAHSILGVTWLQEWKWEEAERELRRAIELNPSNADAYLKHTQLLTANGRHREALAAIDKAQQLDPLSPNVHLVAAANYYYVRDYERCITACRRTLELQPDSWFAYLFMGASHSRRGGHAQAETELRKALQLSRDNPFALGSLGRHYVRAGQTAKAREILTELERRSRIEYVAPSLPAKLYFLLGDPDRGFAWMDKALDAQDQSLTFLAVDPDYAPVRTDPRFHRLLQRIGLES